MISLVLIGWAQTNPTMPTKVSVQAISARCDGSRMDVQWRITNRESRPVFVYSTFLYESVAGFDLDKSGTLHLHTSLKQKLNGGVNFYPEARFLKLAEGSSFEGTLTDKSICSEVHRSKSTAVVMDVAFGFEIDSVNKALRETARSSQHPANPIVEWRTLVTSERIPLN
jgi:hypothetical protein